MFVKSIMFSLIVTFFSVSNADDLEETRKYALENMEKIMGDHKRIVNETLTHLPVRESNLKVISKHEKEIANHILESTIYNTHKSAVSGIMMAILSGSPFGVSPCIEDKEKESNYESQRYYTQKFLNPAIDYEKEADKIQTEDVNKWIQEYNAAVLQFTEIYERTVSDIQKSSDPNDIMRMLYDFGRTQIEMKNIVLKVNGNIDRLQLQFLQILDNLVINIRNSLRVRVDKMLMAVKECFESFPVEKKLEPLLFKTHPTIN